MKNKQENHDFYFNQIQSLSQRVKLIIRSQQLGMIALTLCVFSMITFFVSTILSVIIFAFALLFTLISFLFLLRELTLSEEALTFILKDCEKMNELRSWMAPS
jgi:hypothetical protein